VLAAAVCIAALFWTLAEPADAQPGPSPTRPGDRSLCTPIVSVCVDDVRKGAETLIPGLPIARQAAGVVSDSFSEMARDLAEATVSWYVDTLVSGVSAVLGEFSGFVDATTHPRVNAAALLQPGGAYHTVASISVMLLVGFVFLGVIQGLASGEPGQAIFRLLRDIPIAVLAILGFPWLVDQFLAAADGLAAGILPSGTTTKQLLVNQLLEAIKLVAGGGIAGLLIAVLAFAALVLVHLELVVRDVPIYLVVGLAPLSYAAFVWPAARGAGRKTAEFVGAAILAKPAIFLALRIGLDLTASHGEAAPWQGAPWGRLLVGLAVVCVAAFTPWVIWRLMPHAEAMVVSQGMSRGPARAAMQTLQTAYWVDAIWSRTGFSSGAGRSGGHAGGPAPAGAGQTRGLPSSPTAGPGLAGARAASSGAAGSAAGAGGSGVAASAGAGAGGAVAGSAAAGPAGVAVAGIAAGISAVKAGRDRIVAGAERDVSSAPSGAPPPSGPRPAPPSAPDSGEWTRRRPTGPPHS
jgi:hypothetical protein